MSKIDKLTIEGFKSIRKLENFELRPLNVLIGPNGGGKSNFVGLFSLLREMVEQRLQVALRLEGGADAYLHLGPKVTEQIRAEFVFGENDYRFTLLPTADGQLVFSSEQVGFRRYHPRSARSFGSGHLEARLKDRRDDPGRSTDVGPPWYAFDAISRWVVYHFHDTSVSAGVRRQGAININERLEPKASNLAAFLYRLRETHPDAYREIREVVRLAAPFFDDFKLRPDPHNEEFIQLEWLQRDSDYLFRASQLSDGTLRFICMATALLQPGPPSTMLFDEPELGLHPYALTLLGSLFQRAAKSRQVIVSTQSAPLLNEFKPEDIIVVERANGESTFRRLESANLSEWLEDYSMGELWMKNLLGGRPKREDAIETGPPAR